MRCIGNERVVRGRYDCCELQRQCAGDEAVEKWARRFW